MTEHLNNREARDPQRRELDLMAICRACWQKR